jgi:hypothetical protein
MDVLVKDVSFPISFRVMSLKLIVWYSFSQALMISSFLAAVSSGDPFGMAYPFQKFILTACQYEPPPPCVADPRPMEVVSKNFGL